MKETLYHKHNNTVEPYLTNGIMDPNRYKATIKDIHTKSVAASIAKQKLLPNVVLEAVPPDVSSSEKSLPRIQRTTLAQLRTNYCKRLNDYKHLLGHSDTAVCPECLFRRHTSRHIFNCDATPTNLGVMDLWTNPTLVIDFLKSLPSFAPIFPPDPPAPPPPPEPPP